MQLKPLLYTYSILPTQNEMMMKYIQDHKIKQQSKLKYLIRSLIEFANIGGNMDLARDTILLNGLALTRRRRLGDGSAEKDGDLLGRSPLGDPKAGHAGCFCQDQPDALITTTRTRRRCRWASGRRGL